jgi:hypothetical protein
MHTNAGVEQFFAEVETSVKVVSLALRKLVREAAPEAREGLKWGYPCYEGRKNVCAIHPARGYTRLEFFRANDLADPHRLLEGTGKSLRHVKVRDVATMPVEAISALVEDAFRVDRQD